MKRIFASLIVFLAAVSFTFAAGGQQQQQQKQSGPAAGGGTITFKLAMVDNEKTPYFKGATKIADEVSKATNGRIKIDIAPGGALGGERDTLELAINGDLDIATAANSVCTNFIPEMSILDQAYLWTNANQAHAAVDGKIGDLIQAKANGLGVHVLGYMESGFRNVFSVKPIKAMEDFRGVKIRTMQNQYHMAAFEAFGAMPTPMAAGEQFTALQQGAINAAENAVSNCWNNGFYEITKNITWTNHAFVYILIVMSDKAWKKIPSDLVQPFLDAVKRGYEAERQYLIEENDGAVVKLKNAGVTFYDINVQDLQAAYQAAAKAKGFKFDPAWEAAVQDVQKSVK
ncbi:MAG: TRAP transporter substrate-binding protein [Treponema sp.]|nr:TRAP transporter substrate-binding protein [Treponema sp.]